MVGRYDTGRGVDRGVKLVESRVCICWPVCVLDDLRAVMVDFLCWSYGFLFIALVPTGI